MSWRTLYAFGDSYSDCGAGYLDCNGQPAIVVAAARLGLRMMTPRCTFDPRSSIDFATSGADTSDAEYSVRGAWTARGVRRQVADFAELASRSKSSFDPDNALFFIAAGINDGELLTLDNLEFASEELFAAGARHIALAVLPTFPAAGGVGRRVNNSMEDLVHRLESAKPGLRTYLSQWGALFDLVWRNASDFGFADVVNPCAGRAVFGEDPTPAGDPDTHFFYHDSHPSARVHELVGELLATELDLFAAQSPTRADQA
jgi:hypothetical protein